MKSPTSLPNRSCLRALVFVTGENVKNVIKLRESGAGDDHGGLVRR